MVKRNLVAVRIVFAPSSIKIFSFSLSLSTHHHRRRPHRLHKIQLRRPFFAPLSATPFPSDTEQDDFLSTEVKEDGELDTGLHEEPTSSADEGAEDFDVQEFERQARQIVKEYSDSLSRELKTQDKVFNQKDSQGKQRRCKNISGNIPDHLLPRIAIVGRPNVGKSALFNRLIGGNKAIVVDVSGVTRDGLYGRSYSGDYEFMLVDTGGVLSISKHLEDVMEELAISRTIGMEGIPLAFREAAVARMPSMVEKQATVTVKESSVIIFVVDGQTGLTAADVEIGDWLRKNNSDKHIVLPVNKCESPRKGILQASEFWALGFSPLPISAIFGSGTGELLDSICSQLKKTEKS